VDRARLLIADGEDERSRDLAELLADAGHRVETAGSRQGLLARLRDEEYDLLLVDTALDGSPDGTLETLREVKRMRPSALVVAVSEQPSVSLVLGAFRAGAFEFLEKPLSREQVLAIATRAVTVRSMGEKRRRMAEELESERVAVNELREQLNSMNPFQALVGNSVVFQRLLDTLREVARADSTVLLTGESGTGKGLVARAIHQASARRDGSFVEANCVVYSEGVLHSELFGHERGAFTGAARTKRGRFELARGGSLFLDEIGEIAAGIQLLLLRVLQDRTFERVGGEETLEADVRLIAATNRDLQQAIEEGKFRSDLYYRLNVIPVHLPPLREHADDVPVLAQSFLLRCSARAGREVERFADEAMEAMIRYPWPGNIRELENLVERLVVLNRSGVIELDDLPLSLRDAATQPQTFRVPGTLQELERWRIQHVLNETHGNKKLAARRLGIHRSTLYAKLRRYGLSEAEPSRDSRQHVAESETSGPSS